MSVSEYHLPLVSNIQEKANSDTFLTSSHRSFDQSKQPDTLMTERVTFLFAPADYISYPPKPFFILLYFLYISFIIYFFLLYRFNGYQNILSIRWALPDANVCHSTFKARFKMYFFQILPPAESNRHEKPAVKVRPVTVELHC